MTSKKQSSKKSHSERSSSHASSGALVSHPRSSVERLFSGRVTTSGKKPRSEEKTKKPIEPLPKEVGNMADILVAGRKLSKEIDFKVRYASEKVKEYCLRRFSERYVQTGTRPKNTTYGSKNSIFTFIQTKRTTLTTEKVQALRRLGVSMDNYTELKGIRINYEAIRRHKLELKLREALEKMGVSNDVVLECFQPDVQIKDGFYDHLNMIITQSAKSSHPEEAELAEKMFEVMQILNPTDQIRNAESPSISAPQSFKLIHESDIEVSDSLDVLDD